MPVSDYRRGREGGEREKERPEEVPWRERDLGVRRTRKTNKKKIRWK